MGWNISADVRDKLLRDHTTLEPCLTGSSACTEVVIDGNAAGRSLAVANRRAAAVAKQLLSTVDDDTEQCVICFDNDNVPDVRKREVHSKRAKRALTASAKKITPASAAEIETFTGFGEVEWERMFATSAGKRKALLVICRAVKEEIIRRADPGRGRQCHFTLTMPDVTCDDFAAGVWSYPFDAPSKFCDVLCKTQYGEAEAQVVACIRHSIHVANAAGAPIPTTRIHTIDTDVYLQCLSFAHPHLSVVIGTVWQTSDGQAHSSAARARTASAALRAAKRLKTSKDAESVLSVQRLYKHVSLSGFATATLDGSLARMVNAQWWFLLTGGCDYNFTGLAAFGWNHKTCVDLHRQVVITDTVLDLGLFAAILRSKRNARRRNSDVDRFCDMLARTVYCWYYYQWTGPQPELTQFQDRFVPGDCETVTDWLVAVEPGAKVSMLPLE